MARDFLSTPEAWAREFDAPALSSISMAFVAMIICSFCSGYALRLHRAALALVTCACTRENTEPAVPEEIQGDNSTLVDTSARRLGTDADLVP